MTMTVMLGTAIGRLLARVAKRGDEQPLIGNIDVLQTE
jgi:hypothetical protein